MEIVSGIVPECRRVELAHDAESHEVVERVGRRRCSHDLDVPEADGNRLPPFGAIRLEVLTAQETSRLLHGLVDSGGDLTRVKGIRAAPGNQAKRPGEVGLHEPLARRQRLSIAAEDRFRVAWKSLEAPGDHVRVAIVERETLGGELNRGPKQASPLHLPELPRHRLPRMDVARRRNRFRATPVLEIVRIGRAKHVRIDCSRNPPARIEEPGLVRCRAVHQDGSVAARTGHRRFDDAERGGDCDGGIEGVPSAAQDLKARFGRQRMSGADHG